MLRLFATPKTTPIFPAKICWVIDRERYAALTSRKKAQLKSRRAGDAPSLWETGWPKGRTEAHQQGLTISCLPNWRAGRTFVKWLDTCLPWELNLQHRQPQQIFPDPFRRAGPRRPCRERLRFNQRAQL